MMRELEINLRMESALREQFPSKALADVARFLKSEGMAQLEMYRLFDDFRDRHELDAREEVYEAILDAMDLISGWCPPGAQLFGSGARL
jgi:hypothetical protein